MIPNSSTPILPASNSNPNANPRPTTAGNSYQAPPVPAPPLRTFLTHILDSLRGGISQRRPWGELLDRTAFANPESFSEATLRIRKNYSYFRINYLFMIALILAISLLTNPFSLLVLTGLLASWVFCYLFRPSDLPLVIFGRTFSDFETLSILGVLTVFVIFLTSVGSLLISALMMGIAVVCAHGAFRVPDDLFLNDQETSQVTGFLSFLRGAPVNAPVAPAPPPVAARA